MPAPRHTCAALLVKEGQNKRREHREDENKLREKGPSTLTAHKDDSSSSHNDPPTSPSGVEQPH